MLLRTLTTSCCHNHLIQILSLIERAVINCGVELILNGSHDNFVSCGLIWYLFRANSVIDAIFNGMALLATDGLSLLLAIFGRLSREIEDVLLDS